MAQNCLYTRRSIYTEHIFISRFTTVSGTQFITDTIDGIIKSVPNVMYRDRYLYLCLVTGTFCSNTCEGGKMGKGATYACTSLLIAGTSNPEILSSVTVTF